MGAPTPYPPSVYVILTGQIGGTIPYTKYSYKKMYIKIFGKIDPPIVKCLVYVKKNFWKILVFIVK